MKRSLLAAILRFAERTSPLPAFPYWTPPCDSPLRKHRSVRALKGIKVVAPGVTTPTPQIVSSKLGGGIRTHGLSLRMKAMFLGLQSTVQFIWARTAAKSRDVLSINLMGIQALEWV